MRFRPCIDIHNGKVKQIVGSSLRDKDDEAHDNYVSDKDATYYARLYKEMGLGGGHVIMLNHKGSEYYEATKAQALSALRAYPQGMMAGGGINSDNAEEYLDAGASHVIVTSYVFSGGCIDMVALKRIKGIVGRERLCLDLSCRRRGKDYYIVTDRWQSFTDEKLEGGLLDFLSEYASEFLVHAVDTEGKQQGIEDDVLPMLAESPIPVTYAGGVSSLEDVKKLKLAGKDKIDVTVGSALSIFGGSLEIGEIIRCIS